VVLVKAVITHTFTVDTEGMHYSGIRNNHSSAIVFNGRYQFTCKPHRLSGTTASSGCVIYTSQICTKRDCNFTNNTQNPNHHFPNGSKVCMRTVACGALDTSNSSHFTHYMYRQGNLARHLSRGWLPSVAHYGLDVVYGSSGNGIDGMPIYAQGNGVVERVGSDGNVLRGTYVIIRYDRNDYIARYLHLQAGSQSHLIRGMRVTHTTQIGRTGNTGDSTGPHLHYDVNNRNIIDNGQSANHLNPINLFPANTFVFR
jgi:hypothetical protein